MCEYFDGDCIKPTCEAFPSGIPQNIWTGELRHDKPIKGDHGIQYADNPELLRVKS